MRACNVGPRHSRLSYSDWSQRSVRTTRSVWSLSNARHACLDLAEVILKTKDTKDIEGFWKTSMKSRLNGLAERLEES